MRDLSGTIAAEATPPGRGSIRIVRLSGPEAVPLLKSLFVPQGPLPWERPRRLCLGAVRAPGEGILDRALAVYFRGPDSLTGEDVVELQVHGAPGVVRGVLDLLGAGGARMALPGEFSYRAFLNGKLSVMEAEAVNALVDAETEGQAAGLAGGLGRGIEGQLRDMLDEVLDLRAGWEAGIDFPEDVGEVALAGLLEHLRSMAGQMEGLLRAAPALRYLREGWRLALVGPVNSGKSSLFNALLKRERALVTPHPGTTRDVLEESVQIGRYPLILMDTAGVRTTSDPVERLGVERGLSAASMADGAVLVFDGRKGWGQEEEALLGRLNQTPVAIVANKADLGIQAGHRPDDTVSVSAVTGAGLESLSGRLGAWMEEAAPKGREVLSSERQVETLRGALAGCLWALKTAEEGGGEDLACEGLVEAQRALEACITGGSVEDLYDRIFSRFCIGK